MEESEQYFKTSLQLLEKKYNIEESVNNEVEGIVLPEEVTEAF